jgi:hypothetical protein
MCTGEGIEMKLGATTSVAICGLLMAINGCAGYVRAVKQRPETPQETALDAARMKVHDIEHALPSYINDEGLARLERKEIFTVQADIAIIEQETEQDRFFPEVEKLQDDWGALVALDRVLQQEHLI